MRSHKPANDSQPSRRRPVHGVIVRSTRPTIVFVTVCTKNRQPWLDTHENHELLRSVWSAATAWRVGYYMLMPDHLHLFAAPDLPELPLRNWVKYCKSQFTKAHGVKNHRWQDDYWDRRLRSGESYNAKWEYVAANPVRHGLVARAEDWPFQGTLFELEW
ncbi:MAG: transposase [Phycisphaerae bacterium]|nr:transposase [Phycisphaerae bacterium]